MLTIPSALNQRKRWQLTTILGLCVGYSGYYLCRSNLSVVLPLLIREFKSQGLNKEVMGEIASLGLIFYAVGKIINGLLGDLIGGKKIFIYGMMGSVLFTLIFGLSWHISLFWFAWSANRLIQSMGWGGLVKVTVNWFSFRSYGKVMALLSLSYLFGDIIAKLLLGQLLEWGMGWRGIFMVAASTLAVLALLGSRLLKESPEKVGLEAPEQNPRQLFKETGPHQTPQKIGQLLTPYFKSVSFMLLLLMSFGLTALRESFNFWMPTYLFEATRLSEGNASQSSALFPFFGIISILGVGYLSDTLLSGKRGLILLFACLSLTAILFLMSRGLAGEYLPLILISLSGLFLLGPYSFLAGAMSLDFGGRRGAATAAGLVDATGYLGGTVAIWLTGRVAERSGWKSAFLILAILAFITAVSAWIYYVSQERKGRSIKKETPAGVY